MKFMRQVSEVRKRDNISYRMRPCFHVILKFQPENWGMVHTLFNLLFCEMIKICNIPLFNTPNSNSQEPQMGTLRHTEGRYETGDTLGCQVAHMKVETIKKLAVRLS
jgi:hypothetical protein